MLVVDDEPAIANLAKIKLTNEGFDVVTAHNGEEALERVAAEPPDVIVLDVMMP
ncbi:MAG: response regulator, partial [Actinomycetota bacterium]|nr:response regulator [Actinomycetota bacterium]